jgi:hypothetical protein
MAAPAKTGAPAAGAPELITSAVAHGRTVVSEGRRYGPGALVELPADETARLLGLGFLHNPQAVEIETGMGPVFGPKQPNVVRPG